MEWPATFNFFLLDALNRSTILLTRAVSHSRVLGHVFRLFKGREGGFFFLKMVSPIQVRQQSYKVFTFINNVMAKLNTFHPYMVKEDLEKVYQKLCIIEDAILDVGDIMGGIVEELMDYVGEEDN